MMRFLPFRIFLIFFLFTASFAKAQIAIAGDTLVVVKTDNIKFKYTALIVPVALMTYGVVGIESDYLKDFNSEIREEVNEHIDKKFTIDDFSQLAPASSVYILNIAGVKGKNNFKDRSIVFGTSSLLMATTVYAVKKITKVERPDGNGTSSFPSGHTATAFAGAEFLWQEYKEVSVWYGIAGYAVAAGTGAFRIYNNRHWLTDVLTGAGIGILSTKIAYWLLPVMKDHLFKFKNKNTSFMMAPFYNDKKVGFGLVLNL